jgi:purine-binding chemotaxis protein CheW
MTQTAISLSMAKPAATSAEPIHQFLAFKLHDELFALEILRVQEIRGLTPITPIPSAPEHIRGVMNLRGTIVPVVDLRMRFGLGESTFNRFTVIIVVLVGTRVLGLVVDAVSDVLDVAPTDIAPPPDLGGHVDTTFITGMVQRGEEIVLLLNLDQLLGLEANIVST